MVFPWFDPAPAPSKILLHLVIETRLFRPQGYFPLAAVVVLNSTINIHMYFAQAIYRLNIMFRNMPVPRDTSVSRQIIIVCCESVGNCQTLSKDGPSQLVSSIIFRPFFLLFASDVHRFLLILSRSDVRPPRVLHIVFMFINRQHVYITWYSVMWRYFRLSS